MSIPKSITKEELRQLPILQYPHQIHLITDENRAVEAIEQLMDEPVVGFDTEKRPSFRKGEFHHISLLQLATPTEAFLFRLNHIGFPSLFIDLFENTSIIKTGVAILDDIRGLQLLQEFQPDGFVDLSHEAKKRGFINLGLNALTALFFEKRLSKRVKTSNWERKELSPAQLHYAALDAWMGLQIYEKLIPLPLKKPSTNQQKSKSD